MAKSIMTPEECLTVERAFYEAHGLRSIVAVMCRELRGTENQMVQAVLDGYAAEGVKAEAKLKMVQDMVTGAHFTAEEIAGAKRCFFDFENQEVRLDE